MTDIENTDVETELVSARKLAAKLSLHPKTVHRWAARGFFPVVRVNRRVLRFRIADVQRFIAANTETA